MLTATTEAQASQIAKMAKEQEELFAKMVQEREILFARLKELAESKAGTENEGGNEDTEVEENEAGTDDDNINSN